ncbi:VrrA/YqfQ family protein [Rossellomorea sp. DA94]|jgi:YqfQ-like protein|uniref:VrrA/YqfQ family protein n=1 Tax=Rossellomorea sp. DA94 TaxID=3038653 RepID=UPI00244A57FB|nr:VrrA/YqfQ family protein [Rossellomorea sp. DA94]WGG44256.1 VrrA/YqfQ family protein [Rossellomorea sp. DA94]
MPPRRMRNQGQDMRNPFGMRQRQGNGFGLQQPGMNTFGLGQRQGNGFGLQQSGRNPFGLGQTQQTPFQFGRQNPNQGFNMGMNQRGSGRGRGQGKGLLSKFLKKGENRNAGGGGLLEQFTRSSGGETGFERSPQAAGGIMQTLLNPGNVNSFLSNTQQMLQTAQQLGPMFQQYGPMVKNIPSLWKLYRGFKDMSADTPDEPSTEVQNVESEEIPEADIPVKKKKKKKPSVKINDEEDWDDKAPAKSHPKPKLYI